MRVTTATVALTYQQREQIAKDFLIDLLDDIEYVPFQDPIVIESLKRIINTLDYPK